MENIVSMQVKHKAADDFNEHRELYLKRTAWAGQCSSWFKPGPEGTFLSLARRIYELLTTEIYSKSGDVPWKSSSLYRTPYQSSMGRLGL